MSSTCVYPCPACLFVQIGDTVSVYIRTTTDKAYTIQSESGFSMAYIAPPLSIPAFLGDFGRTLNYRAAGKLEYWLGQKLPAV